MAVEDYVGSVAQRNISFTTTTVYSTVVGQNFQTPVIFLADTIKGANLLGTYATKVANDHFYVTSANYQSVAQGRLLNWLTSFYAVNTRTQIAIVLYNDTTHDIAGAYDVVKTLGYFKFLMTATATEGAQEKLDIVTLAGLCFGDPKLSQFWIGTSDAQTIVSGSTTSIAYLITNAGYDGVLTYKADGTMNPALTQLGLVLANINTTGTPVGNKIDYTATLAMSPSGASGSSLTSAVIDILIAKNVGFWTYVGDGTGSVSVEGFKTLKGASTGATWMTAYINFMASAGVANYLNAPGGTSFKNPKTYSVILSILISTATPFVALERLSNFATTDKSFAALPVTAGDTITIPDAWSATFNERVGKVNVNGTLYVSV